MIKKINTLAIVIILLFGFAIAQAQDENVGNPLLDMLRYVPDTAENRAFVTFGDLATWHESWGVPRIDNLDDMNALPQDQRAAWLFISGQQTIPPDVLGVQFLMSEVGMRGAYGFDLFNVNRYLQAGQPPEMLAIVDFDFASEQIGEALTESGYESQPLDDGTLYSILGDYETDFPLETVPAKVGQLGGLNRIGLLDGRMLIAKATGIIQASLAAVDGGHSLADNPAYVAAVQVLDDPALADTGELVGAILLDAPQLADPSVYLSPQISEEAMEALMESLEAGEPLPMYSVVNFATRHTEGATYLILAVVFPEGVDAKNATDVLSERLQNYVSLITRQALNDYWTFDRAVSTKVNDLPVSLVVMRVDDPEPTPEGETLTNAGIFNWYRMIAQRDTQFLIAG